MTIGILQSAGIAGHIIETALNHPEHIDLFTPVIYSKENQNDKNVSSDLKFGNIQAVVVAPGSATEFAFPGAMTVSVSGDLRLASVMPDADSDQLNSELTADILTDRIRKAWDVVRRDMQVSLPRIAIITDDDLAQETVEQVISPVISTLFEQENVLVFGPYTVSQYISGNMRQHFDMALTPTDRTTRHILETLTDSHSRYLASLPMIMALTHYTPASELTDDDVADAAQSLRDAINLAITVSHNRADYDEAHKNPLPKLYHERRDDSEKVRFAVPKKTEKTEKAEKTDNA